MFVCVFFQKKCLYLRRFWIKLIRRLIFTFVAVVAALGTKAQIYMSSEVQKFALVSYAIQSYYVDTINEKKMIEEAIKDMLHNLDPHSMYIPAEEVQKMNEPLDGSFDGIGVQFQMMEDTLLVIQTISGGPSEKVGIRAGDRIVAVNDSSIAGKKVSTTDIQKKLRGKKGTSVEVKVLRRGVKDLISFKIVRDKIPIYSIDAAYMVTPEIGYIKLNRFSATTVDEYNEAYLKLKKQGVKSLILDLQDNGGGYLSAAERLANEYLPSGQLIVYTEGTNHPRQTYISSAIGNFKEGNLVLLVDEGSASASEILAGAVQDNDRGLIVGRRTFGKGLVQKPVPLPDGSMMRLTVARYYTPSGRCIQRPYKDKGDDYNKDLIERYNHGELMHEDSIVFHDSLKFETKVLGRTVYGGGGVMPDIFVPIDTTLFTNYHRDLVAKGALNKFVLNYVEQNRKKLESMYSDKNGGFKRYLSDFAADSLMMNGLVEAGKAEKVDYNEEEFEKSKDLIALQLKAVIARDLWSVSEYYQIINQSNELYLKAVELLQSPEAYRNGFKKNVKSKAKKK